MDRREFLIRAVSPLLFTVALFLVWEIVCKTLSVPLTILPAPSDVFGALWQYRAPIIDNSWVTLWTTLAGFLIATAFGLVLGIGIGWHRAIYNVQRAALVDLGVSDAQQAQIFSGNFERLFPPESRG